MKIRIALAALALVVGHDAIAPAGGRDPSIRPSAGRTEVGTLPIDAPILLGPRLLPAAIFLFDH